jgi:CubicO group peptidase (beta-lactamase class C family)
VADVENNIPMNIHRIMDITSISKSITATAVIQIREYGQINLDENINVFLPTHFLDEPKRKFQRRNL